ncbi:hypothetical protein CMT69_01660 [Elizabethkingia anophelis]|nr:hypothetical protein [Elizabethkingia anophelis]
MSFVDLAQSQAKMRHIRKHGELSPVYFGFEGWNKFKSNRFIMGSRKCTLLLGGEPNHGKSQVTNELVMQMIEKHNFKVALFTTESGDVEKVFSQFCGLYQGKPYSLVRPDGSNNSFAMSDIEADEAEHFLLDKLYVFKQDRKNTAYQTLANIYKELAAAELAYGIKFDSLVIDPIYDVDDFEPKASEVLRCLNRINLEAEENNRFDIIVNHVAETQKTYDAKTGKRKKLVALADEFYGGKNNNRKAMLQVLVHRPEPTVDENGRWRDGFGNDDPIIRPNQTNIHILKVKPEGVAKWGVYDIYYDWKSRRYYEMIIDEFGNTKKQFANCTKFFEREPNKLDSYELNNFKQSPQQAFNYDNNDEDEDMPF